MRCAAEISAHSVQDSMMREHVQVKTFPRLKNHDFLRRRKLAEKRSELALDEALARLQSLNPRQTQIAEMFYFMGYVFGRL
jgi:hypothetical protein